MLVLGGAMLFLALVKSGKVAEGQLIGVLAFLVAGSLYPPFGVLLGILIVFGMFFRGGGTALFAWLGGLVNRQSGPAVTSQPLAPVAQVVQIPTGYNPFPASTTTINNVYSTTGQA